MLDSPPPSSRSAALLPAGLRIPLKSFEFRKEREQSWRELEDLVRRVETKGIGNLSADELHRLPALYRAALSSLSVARAISLDKNAVLYLESLAARAYICVYSARRGGWAAVVAFVRSGFPALVRSMGRPLWLATALLLLGTACGFLLTSADPERYYSFVDPAMAAGRGPTSTREELYSALVDNGTPVSRLSHFASFLFSHNAKIGMVCFALGFFAGVPVMLLLFSNGLTLGAMIAVYWSKGLGLEFLGWVLPHGVTELLAVCLCGAAGFAVGQSLVFPGVHGRLDRLGERGRAAGAMVVGAVGLFFVAALIEGFFRQLVTGLVPRAALAFGTGAAWLLYFGFASRSTKRSGGSVEEAR